VGESITLTNVDDLITPASYATETTILYDSVAYDTRPYALAYYTPETKDYITITEGLTGPERLVEIQQVVPQVRDRRDCEDRRFHPCAQRG
jgi:hypothetical protein